MRSEAAGALQLAQQHPCWVTLAIPARLSRPTAHGAAQLLFQQEYVPEDKLAEVKRVLYGANQGRPVEALQLPKEVAALAVAHDFDLQAYRFCAAPEQLRAPRIVRIGLIQHAIVKPTTAPFAEQRQVRGEGRHGSGSSALVLVTLAASSAHNAAALLLFSGHLRPRDGDCRGSWAGGREHPVPAGGLVSRLTQLAHAAGCSNCSRQQQRWQRQQAQPACTCRLCQSPKPHAAAPAHATCVRVRAGRCRLRSARVRSTGTRLASRQRRGLPRSCCRAWRGGTTWSSSGGPPWGGPAGVRAPQPVQQDSCLRASVRSAPLLRCLRCCCIALLCFATRSLRSPILERDEAHGETIWNTAVVISNNGNVIGKHRKVRGAGRTASQASTWHASTHATCSPRQLQTWVGAHKLALHTRCGRRSRTHTVVAALARTLPAPHTRTRCVRHTHSCARRTTSRAWATSTSRPTTWRATRGTPCLRRRSVGSASTSATAATTRSTGRRLGSTARSWCSTPAPRSARSGARRRLAGVCARARLVLRCTQGCRLSAS